MAAATASEEYLDQIKTANKRAQAAVAVLIAFVAIVSLTVLSTVVQRATLRQNSNALREAKRNLDRRLSEIYVTKLSSTQYVTEVLRPWEVFLATGLRTSDIPQEGLAGQKLTPTERRNLSDLYVSFSGYAAIINYLYKRQVKDNVSYHGLTDTERSLLIELIQFSKYTKSPQFLASYRFAQQRLDEHLRLKRASSFGNSAGSSPFNRLNTTVFNPYIHHSDFNLDSGTVSTLKLPKEVSSPILPEWLNYGTIANRVAQADQDLIQVDKASVVLPGLGISVTLGVAGLGSLLACLAFFSYMRYLSERMEANSRNFLKSSGDLPTLQAVILDFPLIGGYGGWAYLGQSLLLMLPATVALGYQFWVALAVQRNTARDSLNTLPSMVGLCALFFLVWIVGLQVKTQVQGFARRIKLSSCAIGKHCAGCMGSQQACVLSAADLAKSKAQKSNMREKLRSQCPLE